MELRREIRELEVELKFVRSAAERKALARRLKALRRAARRFNEEN